jgi:hypothetical protein
MIGDGPFAGLAREPMEFPLVHPEHLTADAAADAFTARTISAKGAVAGSPAESAAT